MKAKTLINHEITLDNPKYIAIIKVFDVNKSKKFPEGIKAKFALQNIETKEILLLIDNHAPYSYHMHAKLPTDHEKRGPMTVTSYKEALAIFFEEVERIIINEQ